MVTPYRCPTQRDRKVSERAVTQRPDALDLSIIVPAYNEERRIGPTLEAYATHFGARHGRSWELLVVMNGCTDGTATVVERARRRCPAVRGLTYTQPLGKGGAILEGLREAVGARLVFVDADNMVGPAAAASLVDALDAADIAIGWRRDASTPLPLARRIASALVRLWTRAFLRLPYHDTQCGAKALRRAAIERLLPGLKERGWALDLDILVSARALGLRVVELPVAWRHVPEGSKLRLRQAGWEFLLATWRLRGRPAGGGA